jgi:tetratricopeptide (TPR) repeat protein
MKAHVLGTVFLAALILMAASRECYSQQQPPMQGTEEPPPIGVIDGKICLPSGRSISTNVKVTLATKQAPLVTLYSNQNGEFRFTDLREGRYDIQVDVDPELFLPVSKEVWIRRGTQITLTIYLESRQAGIAKAIHTSTVSAGEFDLTVPAGAKKEHELAAKLIRKSQIHEAIEHLKLAVRIAPGYLTARNDLGVQYLKTGRLADAAEQFSIAIDKNPNYVDPRLNLGLVLIEQHRYLEATERFRQAITMDSSRPVAHLGLGMALTETDQLAEAESELFKARFLGGPQFAVAHYLVAQIELKQGARDQALRELEAYLEEAPKGEMAKAAGALAEKLKSK